MRLGYFELNFSRKGVTFAQGNVRLFLRTEARNEFEFLSKHALIYRHLRDASTPEPPACLLRAIRAQQKESGHA